MSEGNEVIIDNLLCFVNSAKNDYNRENLKDVASAFYSHENTKNTKTTLCVLLKKDLIWRKNPDKKGEDLIDVFDFHEELTSVNL